MASFLAGDAPVSDFDFDRPAAVDAPDGTLAVSVAGQSIAAQDDGNGVVGTWEPLTLPDPGVYPIYVVVTVDGRTERTLVDYLVVCDPAAEWHNVVTARLDWGGAPPADGILHRLLEVARDQVVDYAPATDDVLVPERYRSAQLMQARNTWNASLTNGDQQTDMGGFVMTIRPLDWAVKQLIRPQRAVKAVG